MSLHHNRRVTAALALSLTAGLAACGTTPEAVPAAGSAADPAADPEAELRQGVDSLAEEQVLQVTATLEGDLESLQHPAEGEANDQDRASAALDDGALTLTMDRGDGEGADDDAYAAAYSVAGSDVVAGRYVDGTAYAQVVLEEILGASELAELREQAAMVSGLVPGSEALLDGDWVSLSEESLAEFGNMFGEGTTGTGVAVPSQEQIEETVSSVLDDLAADVEVTPGAEVGHLVVTISTAELAQHARALGESLAELSGQDAAQLPDAGVPGGEEWDVPVTVDVYLSDGVLRAVEFDLGQFHEDAPDTAVRLEVGAGRPVSAPEDATELDLSLVLGMAAGGR